MRKILFILFYFILFQAFSQVKLKDTLYVLYKEDTELIKTEKHKGTNVRNFGILLDIYKNEKFRDSIIERYRKRGGRSVPTYITFSGVRNFVVTDSLDKYKFTTIEDISKLKTKLGFNQKVFFIEKLECNKYMFHETNKTDN
ncbi:hypothetical protein FF125_16190 [Aureibaculum algae]|uniref:Uncharacterized protein n=1 Tax=Aureibaculum algae TaxID=2584122 RepID=A0A5B7TYZ2_9FLAO|nr:hypothetical protein [Aureibaculum algae]QCX39902.1 hypothetical protein FF125_16190 [Aureibaculum algae]